MGKKNKLRKKIGYKSWLRYKLTHNDMTTDEIQRL